MPLPNYSGGTIIFSTFEADTNAELIENLKTKLVAAGWSSVGLYGYVIGTFTGVPANNNTITIDTGGPNTQYTFKTTLTGAAYEVLIGGSAAACASNLFDAITDNSANEGTTYGTGTVAHTTFTAVLNGAAITLQYATVGPNGNQKQISETLANFTLDGTQTVNGGYEVTSVRTPQGLQCLLRLIFDASPGSVGAYIGNPDKSSISAAPLRIFGSVGRVLTIRATRYDFWVYLANSYTLNGVELYGGTLMLPTSAEAKVVASVANNGGLFEITTSAAHGRTTGDSVFIAGATGQTGINGTWQITVIDTDTYTLDASTYASGYTADSARAGGPGEVAQCFWMHSNYVNASNATFRSTIGSADDGSAPAAAAYCLNQYNWSSTSGTGKSEFNVKKGARSSTRIKRWGVFDHLQQPMLCWDVTASGATRYEVGSVWGAVIISEEADMDKVLNSFDGHDWVCFTDRGGTQTIGSLWLATS